MKLTMMITYLKRNESLQILSNNIFTIQLIKFLQILNDAFVTIVQLPYNCQ